MRVAIISLTYNRPEYIARSFESLYSRFNHDFDHYVFDDNSNQETINLLHDLKKKYGFFLYRSEKHNNIAYNFLRGLSKIDKQYDIYIKFDSDIEILSGNFFPQIKECLEYTFDNKKLVAVTPKCEGVYMYQQRPREIDYYGGLFIRPRTSIDVGACMIVKSDIIKKFVEKYNTEDESLQPFGVDSLLYKYCCSQGIFPIIEDLSVYHIDNFFGQRKDDSYFAERNRWGIIDIEYPWFMRLSKENPGRKLPLELLRRFVLKCSNYDEFKEQAMAYMNDVDSTKQMIEKYEHDVLCGKVEFKRNDIPEEQIEIFSVTNPVNFPPSISRMVKSGEIMYFFDIPEWARADYNLVIEKMKIPRSHMNKYIKKVDN